MADKVQGRAEWTCSIKPSKWRCRIFGLQLERSGCSGVRGARYVLQQLLVSLGLFHGETQDVGDHFQRNFLNQKMFCFLNHSRIFFNGENQMVK